MVSHRPVVNLADYKVIFWDFDGVIKDSVEVKTHAYVDLFSDYGAVVAAKVREHHLANGGVSRFEKIPLYLRWADEAPTQELVDLFCAKFSQLALQGVVESAWVAGVEEYLRTNPHMQTNILVSATPQVELEQILLTLDLQGCFSLVFGAPTKKNVAVRHVLETSGSPPGDCILIGDALADFEAAQANQIDFLLRRHDTNNEVFSDYGGPSIRSFLEL